MRIFKFELEYYDKGRNKIDFFKGLIAGENLGDAASHIVSSCVDDVKVPYSVKIEFIEDMDEGIVPYDEIPDFED